MSVSAFLIPLIKLMLLFFLKKITSEKLLKKTVWGWIDASERMYVTKAVSSFVSDIVTNRKQQHVLNL